MQKNADLYNLTQHVQGSVFQAGRKYYQEHLSEAEQASQAPVHGFFQIRSGYAESPGWMMIQVIEFSPDGLNVEKFRRRAVYSAPRLSQAILELLASEKWLNRIGEDYHLRDEGQKIVSWIKERRVKPFANFEPMPANELSRLIELSRRILDSCATSGDEQAVWCLAHSRKRTPDSSASNVAKLVQLGDDFNAFRDDAHMAAYSAIGVDGMTWEAFAHIHNDLATSAETIFQELAYRGWTLAEWQGVLLDLENKAWIEATGTGAFVPTAKGKDVYQEIEIKTDELFYDPWSVISNEELIEFVSLNTRLNEICMGLISQ